MARPRTDIRPRLLRAARERFLADGVDGASLRAIARTAGSSVGMLHYYFQSKDDLFLAVIEEVYGRLVEDLSAQLKPSASFEDRLARLYRRFSQIGPDELDIVRLVLREFITPASTLRGRVLERFHKGHLPLVAGMLTAGMAEGKLDPRYPLPLLLVFTFAIGAAPQVLRHAAGAVPVFAGLPDASALADLSLEALLRGVGPRAAHEDERPGDTCEE